MPVVPSKPEALQLMMEGAQALTDVEEAGMRIDTEYLEKAIVATRNRIEQLSEAMRDDDVYLVWRRKYGTSADIGSRAQLADIVFGELGYECRNRSKKNQATTDKASFEHIDLPFLKWWVEYQSLKSRLPTDLIGTKNQVDSKGFLHPVYNLHFVVTYRSGCRDPNFMNKPARDKMLARLVRRMFIPRTDDHILVEVDFAAHEWRGAANFWKDPQMIRDASDSSRDVHRDMAAECYLLKTSEVSKGARAVGKNKFVFPSLYGSYYKSTGRDMWDAVQSMNLAKSDGTSLADHLRSKGLTSKDRFIDHMKKVESAFNNRYPHWSEQKDIWWKEYLRNGAFPLMTGFACRGVYSYNDAMNYPIQGPSFHLLLWSLIQINAYLKKHKMGSRVIGQIHDSIMLDLHKNEKDDVINELIRIMTVRTAENFKWVIVRPEAEVEASAVNWYEKKPWVLKNGTWQAL